MSQDEKAPDEATQPPVQEIIAMPHDIYMRRQAAAEAMEFKRSGIKLDETRPGGYFIGTDGKPHDAEGRPIKE